MLSKIEGVGGYALKHLNESKYLKLAEKELAFMDKYSVKGL